MAETTDPVAAAQQALADFKNGHDDYVAQFKPSVEALDPGWKAKAEGQYNTELSRLQHEADYQQSQAAKAGGPPQTPAQAAITGTTAEKDAAVLAEMKANQAAGKGFKTNAQVDADAVAQGHLQTANDQLGLGNARLGLAQQQAELAAKQAQIRDDLAQKRIDLTEALRQQQALNAQMLATARDQTNQVNLYGHMVTQRGQDITAQGQAVTQADTRSTNAASILNNQGAQANDAAQHGSFVAGTNEANMLASAPGFQASMGGAPVALTTPQKIQIGQALLNGAKPADVIPQIVAGHVQNMTTGPQFSAPAADPNVPAWGPMSAGASAQRPTGQYSPGERFEAAGGVGRPALQVAVPPGYGTGPGQVMPQFTAPAAA